jgi:O-antigen/teichoic acid export membrane protein
MASEAWPADRDHEAAAGPSVETTARLRRNLAALAGGQATTWLMSLAWTIVVPRALGPTNMGILVTALAVTGVLGVALGLGTRNYLVREIVVDPLSAPGLLGTGVVLRLVLTPLFVAAILIYARLAHFDGTQLTVLYLVAGAVILTMLAEPMQAGFQAIERMQYIAYTEVVNKSSQGVVGIVLVLAGFGVVSIAASSLVVAGVLVAANAYWLSKYVRVDLRTDLHRLVDMVRQSLAYWAFGLFFLFYLWIDSVMLSLMTRPEVVAWYGVPTKLFQTMMFVPVLVSTAWLPRLVAAFERDPRELGRAARTPLELVLVLAAPICAGTAMLAGPAIGLLYGSAYDEAAPVLVVLGLCIPLMYANVILNQVLVAAKRQVWWTWVMAGATAVNPVFNFVLIRITESRFDNGAIGAALSLLLTEALIVSVGFVIVGRSLFGRRQARRVTLCACASAAMWGVAEVAQPLGTLEAAALGVATFLVLAVVFRLVTAEEMDAVRATAARVLRRSGTEAAGRVGA